MLSTPVKRNNFHKLYNKLCVNYLKLKHVHVIRSDFVLPKIYQRPNVVLTKHVIVERFSHSFVIRWKGKWILQKRMEHDMKGHLGK
jgi:hypothetical protein